MTTNGGFQPVFCTIVPPHVLDRLAQHEDPALSGPARQAPPPPPAPPRRSLEHDAYQRTHRRLTTVIGAPTVAPPAGAAADQPHRTVYDAHHTQDLPGRKVRAEGSELGKDA